MEEGGSPYRTSRRSVPKRPSASTGSRPTGSSDLDRKDFLRKFVDSEIFIASLDDWFSEITGEADASKPAFDVPFEITELQNFDYALEGVSFRQLVRMPNALHGSTSDSVEATAYLAIEDFLHGSMKGLWETFWGEDVPMPFTVVCVHSTSSKFYTAEKALASGKLDGLCATAIVLKSSRHHSHGKWDQILELALLRPDIGTSLETSGTNQGFSYSALGEAIFFGLRVLLSRSLSRSSTIARNSNCVYVLLVDSQQGGVVRVQGDVNKLDLNINNVYECAAQWIKLHANITVSMLDRIWNKMGNANWGDIGTLQVLFATFHCMLQFCGMPKHTVEELAAEHSSRLQSRRTERRLMETHANGTGVFPLQQRSASPEIVEIQDEPATTETDTLKLEKGAVLWLEESNWQKGFQINENLTENELKLPVYCASPLEEPGKMFLLYVGSIPSHLDSMWEDMDSWYQVQRQTKILTQMKQRDISSKYLPHIAASGRIIHPGECNKSKSSDKCSHPWCSTPILVISPFGETLSSMIRNGSFGPDQALRCCHDCLSALALTSLAGIRHGDIRPENVIHVTNGVSRPYFVLIGWGHAVLEDRDRPSTNLYFSSTLALQEGKLCAASDAESLIYLLYFSCGGSLPEADSIEEVLQWREISWSKRVIQQKLGDVSAVLKAFADYVDSLCGTPYPIDYKIWLRRLRRTMNEEDNGNEIEDLG